MRYFSSRPVKSSAQRLLFHVLATTTCWLLVGGLCFAGGGPEDVFLVVNSASHDSMTVANHYVDLRKIPPTNVFYIHWQDPPQTIGSATFRERILRPTLEEIDQRQLSSQIDYVVYSCDFPTRINYAGEFQEETFPKQWRALGSLTSATYFYAFVMNKRKEMIGPRANFYCAEEAGGSTISRGFRGQYRWAPGGKRTGEAGLPYLLSAMLGVTAERGNSVEEIISYLTRSTQADGSKPKGTVYFMRNNTPRSSPRHDQFPAAIKEIRAAGGQAKLLDGKFPSKKYDIIGVTCGTPHYDVKASGSRLLPGAICDNLTSFGGGFSVPKGPSPGRRPQTNVCEFLRYGGAGAWGTVVEPYNIAEKFSRPSVHMHYARGCSLAEAFYQSISGPYQQILVGDPLCQPMADIPQLTLRGVSEGAWLRGKVKISPEVESSTKNGMQGYELYFDGVRLQTTSAGNSFFLDTNLLDDGHHELRVVGVADSPIKTQCRWLGNVVIKNGIDAVELKMNRKSLAQEKTQLELEVVATSQRPVVVYHHEVEVGRVAAGTGKLQVETRLLGSGPITLYAKQEGKKGLRSPPLRIDLPSSD